jgi:hypothetical protein
MRGERTHLGDQLFQVLELRVAGRCGGV